MLKLPVKAACKMPFTFSSETVSNVHSGIELEDG